MAELNYPTHIMIDAADSIHELAGRIAALAAVGMGGSAESLSDEYLDSYLEQFEELAVQARQKSETIARGLRDAFPNFEETRIERDDADKPGA
jgi:hypothetical protein